MNGSEAARKDTQCQPLPSWSIRPGDIALRFICNLSKLFSIKEIERKGKSARDTEDAVNHVLTENAVL